WLSPFQAGFSPAKLLNLRSVASTIIPSDQDRSGPIRRLTLVLAFENKLVTLNFFTTLFLHRFSLYISVLQNRLVNE
ncbi:hypothetical protein ACFPPD_23235, partial [Cohnella suwonensis]